MTRLRTLVLIASTLDLLVGAAVAYALLWVDVPDAGGFLLSFLAILAGLGGLAAAHREGWIRVSIAANALVAALIGTAATIVCTAEGLEGRALHEILLHAAMFAAIALPFAANVRALGQLRRASGSSRASGPTRRPQ